MTKLHRRQFLGASAGLVAACSWGSAAAAKDAEAEAPAAGNSATGFAPDSLFLTWQRDPTTTMTVQWVGPERAEAQVQYAIVDGEQWQAAKVVVKEFPDTDLKVHRCELTGLTPGAEYRFRISGAESSEVSGLYRFRTMPDKATNTIQFVTGGDCGTGSHAVGTNILAAKQEPHFAFIGGDLAYDNGSSPNTFLKFLQNYSQHMLDPKGRLIPMLACIGNHEVRGGYGKPRAAAPHYLSVFDGFYEQTTYGVLDIGDYLGLVLLDTGHVAAVGGEQTAWLDQTLAERAERQHLLVANHVPAYPSHREWKNKSGTGIENRKHWCPLFEKHKVDAVLEHHDHTFKRTHALTDGRLDKNGVVYLGDGSWGKLRPLSKPEQRPYLAAYGEAYHMTVHRLEGDRRFHVALEESGKVADVCTTVSKRVSRRG